MKRMAGDDCKDKPLSKQASSDRALYRTGFDSVDEYMTFYSKSVSAGARSLSNFSSHNIAIDYSFIGCSAVCQYPTGEHAFQGGKFQILGSLAGKGSERQEELLAHASTFEGDSVQVCSLSTPAAAKKAGGKSGIRLTDSELALWECYTMILQEQICREKLKSADIRECLASTGDLYLVHFERATTWPRYGACVLTPEKSPFADGRRWMKGDNLLGIMWMELRKELLQEADDIK
jgi:predicted NAD-dependent protein-ADP-ribosyltransferase YbiA (DUF1768 family)